MEVDNEVWTTILLQTTFDLRFIHGARDRTRQAMDAGGLIDRNYCRSLRHG